MLAALLLALMSCKDEDPVINSSITGSWKGDRADVKVKYGIVPVHEETDEQFDATLEFRDDGTVSFTKDGTTTSGTYELNGSTLTTNVDFQFEGVDIESMTFSVLELTATRLRLDVDQDQEVNVPDFGTVETNIKGNFEFDRL